MEARIPYPLDEKGVPICPEGLGECYDVCLRGIRDTNKHHLAFNRASYKSQPERWYREAPGMVIGACVCKHADLHATYLPPSKPSIHVMHDIIQGDIEPTVAQVFIRSRNDSNLESLA